MDECAINHRACAARRDIQNQRWQYGFRSGRFLRRGLTGINSEADVPAGGAFGFGGLASMPARSCFTCAACLACVARTAANSRSIFACSSSLTTLVSRAGGRSFTAGYCISVAGRSGVPAGSPPAQDGMVSIAEVEQPGAASASISAIAVRWYLAVTSFPEHFTKWRDIEPDSMAGAWPRLLLATTGSALACEWRGFDVRKLAYRSMGWSLGIRRNAHKPPGRPLTPWLICPSHKVRRPSVIMTAWVFSCGLPL